MVFTLEHKAASFCGLGVLRYDALWCLYGRVYSRSSLAVWPEHCLSPMLSCFVHWSYHLSAYKHKEICKKRAFKHPATHLTNNDGTCIVFIGIFLCRHLWRHRCLSFGVTLPHRYLASPLPRLRLEAAPMFKDVQLENDACKFYFDATLDVTLRYSVTSSLPVHSTRTNFLAWFIHAY